MNDYAPKAAEILKRVRDTTPVIHNITNYVVMNSTANVLLAMGASPIMAHAPEEIEELVNIVRAVVINIGTLSRPWIDSMLLAAQLCRSLNKPFLLDPVGAGATTLRTGTALRIIEAAKPTIVRGNPSEVLSLSAEGGFTRGVDSVHTVEQADNAARETALSIGCTIAVTGACDLVTDGHTSLLIKGGHRLFSMVTGTGCAVSAIVAAFMAVEPDPLLASASALAFFKLAGEQAAQVADAPGSFWVKVIDSLYKITPKQLQDSARITKA